MPLPLDAAAMKLGTPGTVAGTTSGELAEAVELPSPLIAVTVKT